MSWAILLWDPNEQEKWHTGQCRLKMLPQDKKQYQLDESLMKWKKGLIVLVVLKNFKKYILWWFYENRWKLIPMCIFICDVVCVCVCGQRERELSVLIQFFLKKMKFLSRKFHSLIYDITEVQRAWATCSGSQGYLMHITWFFVQCISFISNTRLYASYLQLELSSMTKSLS